MRKGEVGQDGETLTLCREWQREEYKEHDFREHVVNDSGI